MNDDGMNDDPQQPGGGNGGPQANPHPVHHIKVAINTEAPKQQMASAPAPQPQQMQPQPQPQMGMAMPQPQGGQSPLLGQQQANQATGLQPKPKPRLPKGPPKEPTPPRDVQAARKRQTNVLKTRQKREIQGKPRGGVRDVDAGAGFWPPLSPLL